MPAKMPAKDKNPIYKYLSKNRRVKIVFDFYFLFKMPYLTCFTFITILL